MFTLNRFDDLSRRAFITRAAQSLLGVTLLPAAGALAAAEPSPRDGKAKQVIYLFMNGAMSQLDTFDPKPGTEEQGETSAINTAVPGIQVSEHFPLVAKQMPKVAIIRSLSTGTGAHQPGRYLMHTSYKEIASTRHPAMGAYAVKLAGKLNPDLPGNVLIGNTTQHPGAGFLDAEYSPVPIGNPASGLQNTTPPKYLEESQFARRMSLAGSFDQTFQRKYQHRDVRGYSDLYREAIKLLKSKDLKAFDINEEPENVRAQYGDNALGQGCLLARRLIENRVRYVEVSYGNWDHHRDIFTELPEVAQTLDQALSALLADLESKGLLESTLVVVATEFGRTPHINQNTGRDHHPGAFCGVLAGGGIRGGQVYGETDEQAHSVIADDVSVADFNATIAHALGLSLDQEIISPSGRPFKVAHDGRPLKSLFG